MWKSASQRTPWADIAVIADRRRCLPIAGLESGPELRKSST